jgi:hypothetical protein
MTRPTYVDPSETSPPARQLSGYQGRPEAGGSVAIDPWLKYELSRGKRTRPVALRHNLPALKNFPKMLSAPQETALNVERSTWPAYAITLRRRRLAS